MFFKTELYKQIDFLMWIYCIISIYFELYSLRII